MSTPNFKVTVTHGGSDTNYVNEVFSRLQVKRRENHYDVATLVCEDEYSVRYLDYIDVLDEIKIYAKETPTSAYTQIFGGTIRQANPTIAPEGFPLTVLCKGYGAALDETNCNRDYGVEAQEIPITKLTKATAKEILQDLVDNYINKSLGSADNTGYTITKTKIADLYSGTPIRYINNPYRTCRDVVDLVCALTSAIGAGLTAGAHWIVDNNQNLIVNTIGLHENPTEWPDWWNTDEADSTLTQGVDFTNFSVLDKSEEFANKVVLITDFRRPSYDYWTEDSGGAALWEKEGLASITNSTVQKVVGSHSLLFTPSSPTTGYGIYPKTFDAHWDVTKWGSEKTIPRLNFYVWKHGVASPLGTFVYMSTNKTARKTDFFWAAFLDWQTEPDDTWLHKSIPIGPYWASAQETQRYRWNTTLSPSWGDPASGKYIDSIEFVMMLYDEDAVMYIDDLHFSGKIIRSAKNNGNIAVNKEYQKVLISRNAMDDSCVAADDSGFAGRITYAELLRRLTLPTTITFQVKGKPQMMPGQKCKPRACKKADGTFRIDTAMRMLTVVHDITADMAGGFLTTATATTDLKNSTPISVPDQYAMWMENMFLNSKEAKNIRSGAEVDLLIPILENDYP